MTQRSIRRLTLFMLLAPFALWILLLILLPHLGIFGLSLREKVAPLVYTVGPGNYLDFFREPIYWNTLLRTASFSILVTVLTFAVGFPIAYYIAKIAGPAGAGGAVPRLPDSALGERPGARLRLDDPAPRDGGGVELPPVERGSWAPPSSCSTTTQPWSWGWSIRWSCS